MSQFTKKAIFDAFIKLITERPFDKITVKDIVTECGVNRNTFYYYFEDIYALVDELFQIETQKILGDNTDYSSWQEAFFKAIDFLVQNKMAIYHIYKHISREQVENYLNRVAFNNISVFVRNEAEGLNASEEDIKLVAKFYSHALVGEVLEWLSGGMKTDPRAFIERLGVLFDGNIRYSFSKNK